VLWFLDSFCEAHFCRRRPGSLGLRFAVHRSGAEDFRRDNAEVLYAPPEQRAVEDSSFGNACARGRPLDGGPGTEPFAFRRTAVNYPRSLWPAALPSLCSTAMAVIMATEFLWPKSSICECGAMSSWSRIGGESTPSRLRCYSSIYTSRYGLSDGSPSEKGEKPHLIRPNMSLILPGLQIDAQTALDYITSDPCFSKTPIVGFTVPYRNHDERSFQILYGQSIGGAVSIDLASRNPSKVNCFSSAFTVVS
jgi:hypothetical protein